MREDKGPEVARQSNSSVETEATKPVARAREIMLHYKLAMQAERRGELKTDNDSVDSQNLCGTRLKN